MQGRNFSYLDTQLKRLGSPNFSYLPVNAPKCPMATFQQDGHMATGNPTSRANYEPNSWDGSEGGPREDPQHGFTSFVTEEGGGKRRLRAESFADHYSQARQFFISQTEIEQQHIIAAFTFELSKCDEPKIRTRMVAGLRNVHPELAQGVAAGLGLRDLPDRLPPAREPATDLPASPALSILRNGPGSFAGRKLGVLVTDGVDLGLLSALREAIQQQDAVVTLVAPAIGGVRASDGSVLVADEQVHGGPSVVYDAVAVLTDEAGAALLTGIPPARDFVNDAFAHCKFIGHSPAVAALFEALGLSDKLDDGVVELADGSAAAGFVQTCGQLRYWPRAETFS